ncbi:MAG: RluA family pseudouridine synthase [Clostridia bacterium]|nr:RluA family pseudouridine synthase [Clostridia bacterium]
MSDKRQMVVNADYEKVRLDVYLSEQFTEITRSAIKKLITDGKVLVNSKQQKAGYVLRENDIVDIEIPQVQVDTVGAEDIPLDIVYEDNDLLVINKAQGMTVHPASTVKSGTLVNALLYKVKELSSINGEYRPGIVHRLDKDTSGLMLVAKNDKAHNNLAKQIADKTCVREYVALVTGVMTKDEGEVETLIARDPKNRLRMAVMHNGTGRVAKTRYWVEKRFRKYTLVAFRLATGRTHQIRVHTKYLGYPIVGDTLYNTNKDKFNLSGQLLHSRHIEFRHPTTGEWMKFDVGLPEYFESVLQKLD